jgi:hypothetical protein
MLPYNVNCPKNVKKYGKTISEHCGKAACIHVYCIYCTFTMFVHCIGSTRMLIIRYRHVGIEGPPN